MTSISPSHRAHALSLGRFIDEAPSPYHVVQRSIDMLDTAGFRPWQPGAGAGRWFLAQDGSVVAWIVPDGAGPTTPFRVVGAHTDSPNLRLKPHPDANAAGWRRLAVEVYGGVLLNSWLDRDCGLSGRLAFRGDDGVSTRLVHIGEPILRVPQLAIHLDREVNERLRLNKQDHLAPVWGIDDGSARSIIDVVAASADIGAADILGFELMLHDVTPSGLIGVDEELLSAPRLDNQLSCHAAMTALAGANPDAIAVVALFDHEEVGSVSTTGAATAALPARLRLIADGLGATADEHAAALAASLFVSSDNAHATHPNYPAKHDPGHYIACNGGPALKFNANQRYTTDAVGAGLFELAAERAGVSTQRFVSRSDMPCGSTIGPTVAASTGMRALDVGVPQLAMHSARELCGAADPWDLTLVLAELLSAS